MLPKLLAQDIRRLSRPRHPAAGAMSAEGPFSSDRPAPDVPGMYAVLRQLPICARDIDRNAYRLANNRLVSVARDSQIRRSRCATGSNTAMPQAIPIIALAPM